jgi:hypothetical protein
LSPESEAVPTAGFANANRLLLDALPLSGNPTGAHPQPNLQVIVPKDISFATTIEITHSNSFPPTTLSSLIVSNINPEYPDPPEKLPNYVNHAYIEIGIS